MSLVPFLRNPAEKVESLFFSAASISMKKALLVALWTTFQGATGMEE